jgi:hypothetical protein
LAPTDFWSFAALKKPLKGIHVTCDEEVQAVTGKYFREQPQEFYTDGFKNLFSAGGVVPNEGDNSWKSVV